MPMTSVDISLFKSKFLKILGFFGFYLVAWQAFFGKNRTWLAFKWVNE